MTPVDFKPDGKDRVGQVFGTRTSTLLRFKKVSENKLFVTELILCRKRRLDSLSGGRWWWVPSGIILGNPLPSPCPIFGSTKSPRDSPLEYKNTNVFYKVSVSSSTHQSRLYLCTPEFDPTYFRNFNMYFQTPTPHTHPIHIRKKLLT